MLYRSCIGSGIMRITYGIDIEKEATPYMAIAAETMATFAAVFVPGKYLVETFPILRFIPSWFPGARFKREGEEWTRIVRRLRDTPWNATAAAMVRSICAFVVTATHTKDRGMAMRRLRLSCRCWNAPQAWKAKHWLKRLLLPGTPLHQRMQVRFVWCQR